MNIYFKTFGTYNNNHYTIYIVLTSLKKDEKTKEGNKKDRIKNN